MSTALDFDAELASRDGDNPPLPNESTEIVARESLRRLKRLREILPGILDAECAQDVVNAVINSEEEIRELLNIT